MEEGDADASAARLLSKKQQVSASFMTSTVALAQLFSLPERRLYIWLAKHTYIAEAVSKAR